MKDAVPNRTAGLLHAVDRNLAPEARNLARQSVSGRAGLPDSLDAVPGLSDHPRHHWLGDPKRRLDFLPPDYSSLPKEGEELVQPIHE